jgi:hypothetical protein
LNVSEVGWKGLVDHAGALGRAIEDSFTAGAVVDTGVAALQPLVLVFVGVGFVFAAACTVVDVVIRIEALLVAVANLSTRDVVFDLVGRAAGSDDTQETE